MDRISKSARSANMARIRGRETNPEMELRRALWQLGLRYRTHARLPGRPDIAFLGLRIAIFVDGCFWHSCPIHGVMPKTNRNFWQRKLRGNRRRDLKNEVALKSLGWDCLRFWEHEIEHSLRKCSTAIARRVAKKRRIRAAATRDISSTASPR